MTIPHVVSMDHDAYAQPPGDLRVQFRKWQKSSVESLAHHPEILDTADLEGDIRVEKHFLSPERRDIFQTACERFSNDSLTYNSQEPTYFEIKALPGVTIHTLRCD